MIDDVVVETAVGTAEETVVEAFVKSRASGASALKRTRPLTLAALTLLLFGCSGEHDAHDKAASAAETSATVTKEAAADGESAPAALGLEPEVFAEGAIVGEVETVDCTLSGGTQTTCYQFRVAGAPADPQTSPEGPFCPPNIHSGEQEGGTWMDGEGTLYQVDGEFIKNLATLYKDKEWQMYDVNTGEITVIDGARGCEVAGNPNPIEGFDNFCLECPLEELGGGIEKTVVIPKVPVPAAEPTSLAGRSNTGVALNGVLFGPPAPLELILSSHTLGVLDDCGAHANPHEGYHYHTATGCSEIGIQEDGHSPMIGYALDGYAIYAREDKDGNIPADLDECGGETDPVRGYHCHALAPGVNQIFGCFMGEKGHFLDEEGGERPPQGPPGE